jgi:predicted transcriptional regulator of viral defense system
MAQAQTSNRLMELAEQQWGLVTRAQASAVGIAPATLSRMTMPGSALDRVSHGVYRMPGSPLPDHLDLRAAWLQLAPETPAWQRTPDQGVVSHRSAATLFGLGDLPADRHEFTVAARKQTRRKDVRLHRRSLRRDDWQTLAGLPVTAPARIAADLLSDGEEPDAVGRVIADALRAGLATPVAFASALAPQAQRHGFQRGNGLGVLRWLLELTGDPATSTWLKEATP